MARDLLKCIFWGILCSGLAGAVYAQDSQAELARRIEALSYTDNSLAAEASSTTFFSLYETRRFIEVSGCEFVLRAIATIDGEERFNAHIMFDVSRATFPDFNEENGDNFAFMPALDDGLFVTNTARFSIQFLEPYQPSYHVIENGIETDQPLEQANYTMDPVEDERQVRDLLAAINRYKRTYCLLSG